MVKINVKPDCGNSPKMEFIKNFNIAFANSNFQKISDSVSEDISYISVGQENTSGKEAFIKLAKSSPDNKMTELEIHTIISHGKFGAANGKIQMENGQIFEYCDIYE